MPYRAKCSLPHGLLQVMWLAQELALGQLSQEHNPRLQDSAANGEQFGVRIYVVKLQVIYGSALSALTVQRSFKDPSPSLPANIIVVPLLLLRPPHA